MTYGFRIDPGNVRAQDVEEAERQAERVQALLAEEERRVSEIVGTGGGDSGQVSALVAADGRVLEVTLQPRATRDGSEALAEEIQRAVQRAQLDAQRQAEALLRESLAEALPSLDAQALQERLGRLLD
ncbi:YbaB/EbfC family nucleoid-associated protein [Nonomuraea cavernae]|uniref:YbaB/EbfC family DNA-binding protein n=1 Tax=Nonomuraea cavernae TaxID=2045107 RepID=A0A917YY87_9ACTN|nr:YbaB/EbfC family nucleoid-associated protein [Nonomuraea cavernae]MCA2187240.1 YbaB/EbfC family nucleoid-associated protein [Nonomuraea cavernae]GGO68007.1 hypothetical protein GCM10012289_25770 [Nonomuraea cavernae]